MRRRSLCGLAAGIAGSGVIPAILLRRQAVAQESAWVEADINGLHYEVLLPQAYDAAQRYPVVLYLHQLAMGTYREGLFRQVNTWFRAPAFRSRHSCIVVVPMLDQTNDPDGRLTNFGGKRNGHFGEDNTIAALKQVIGRYSTDLERLYVTGNSLGGMGTWQMLLAYNTQTGSAGHLFAAGMPLAGTHRTADPVEAAKVLRHVPIWAIHGATDHEVLPDWDRTMAKLLSGSPTFRYTEDAHLSHDVWDSYYTRADVWNWLFAQRAEQ